MLMDASVKWEVWQVRSDGVKTLLVDTVSRKNAMELADNYAYSEDKAAKAEGRDVFCRYFVCRATTTRNQAVEVPEPEGRRAGDLNEVMNIIDKGTYRSRGYDFLDSELVEEIAKAIVDSDLWRNR